MPLHASLRVLDSALERLEESAATAQKWRVVGKQERALEKAMTRAFRAQGKEFLKGFAAMKPLFESAQVREAWTDDDWLQIFDEAAGNSFFAFLRPLQRSVQTSLVAGANNLIGQIGMSLSFRLTNARAISYIDAHGASLVTGINGTTRDYIKTLMHTAASEGWSYNRTAQALTDRFKEFAIGKPQDHVESRAHLIAITEVGNAYEEGNSIVVQDLADAGIRMEKKWLTTGDNRVSDGCRDNANDGWIPIEQPHSSGDMQPLRFPSCRCTELYRRARN